MSTARIPVKLLAACMACAGFAPSLAQAQVLLSDPSFSFSQSLGSNNGAALFASGISGNGQATNTDTSSSGIGTLFNSDKGVLVSVTGQMSIVPMAQPTGTGLPYFRTFSNEGLRLQGSISTQWQLGSQQSAPLTLITAVAPKDTANYHHTQDWQSVSTTLAASDGLVAGSGSTASSVLTTTVMVAPTNGGKNADIQGYLSATNSSVDGKGAIHANVNVSLSYNYLKHSTSTFLVDQGASTLGDTPAIDFDAGLMNSTSFRIGNVGDASTSSLFFKGASCIGSDAACNAYKFSTESFSSLAAGSSVAGLFTFDAVKSGGATDATVTLTFRDGMGTEASRRNTTLAINVYGVAAVPEPHGAAMLLAGLGAIGWMSRRRRSARDQVAKL